MVLDPSAFLSEFRDVADRKDSSRAPGRSTAGKKSKKLPSKSTITPSKRHQQQQLDGQLAEDIRQRSVTDTSCALTTAGLASFNELLPSGDRARTVSTTSTSSPSTTSELLSSFQRCVGASSLNDFCLIVRASRCNASCRQVGGCVND